MSTQTLNRIEDSIEPDTITAPDIDRDTLSESHSDAIAYYQYSATPKPPMSRIWSNIGSWVLAVGVATSPVAYVDPKQELRRSGASSVFWSYTKRRGTPITLAQARELAMRILSDTEQRLKEERESEARFLLSIWEEED